MKLPASVTKFELASFSIVQSKVGLAQELTLQGALAKVILKRAILVTVLGNESVIERPLAVVLKAVTFGVSLKSVT